MTTTPRDCTDDQAADQAAPVPERRAQAIIGVTATRAPIIIGYDTDPDGDAGRALCQDYADETGEPVAVYAVPMGDANDAVDGPTAALPFVGTFAPAVTGPCWNGRTYAGDDPHPCTLRARTTVPASLWDAGSQHAYPANVPLCHACASEFWAAEEAAERRAEERATVSDALT